jgi:V8-like Glu-specific endopeptidase
MEWSTYAIGTTKGMATCVIVNRRDVNAPSGAVPVLVTSAHVLSVAPHGPYFLAARIPKSGASPDIAILEFQIPSDRQPAYVKHPRHDVAAIALRIPSDIAKEISLPSFLNESAIATRGTEPHIGEEISVLGFPRVFPGTEGGFAVLRGGKIASYSAGPAVSREKFLVNANVYAGDSGGPVFAASERRTPKLIGLLTERIGPKSGAVPLAVAVNATVIRETLELLAQREDQPVSTSPISPRSVAPRREERVKLVAPPRFFADTTARKSSLIRIRLLPRK